MIWMNNSLLEVIYGANSARLNCSGRSLKVIDCPLGASFPLLTSHGFALGLHPGRKDNYCRDARERMMALFACTNVRENKDLQFLCLIN